MLGSEAASSERNGSCKAAGFAAVAAAIAAALLICGCGGAGGRQSIEGTVTLDGKPLEKGQITFVPQSGTQGPTAGAEIIAGRFAIPALWRHVCRQVPRGNHGCPPQRPESRRPRHGETGRRLRAIHPRQIQHQESTGRRCPGQ